MVKILIVEHDGDKAFLFQNRLAVAGYDVEAFHDGSTAINKVMFNRYDLIIISSVLPSMRADLVCQTIREIERDNDLPQSGIVIMSDDAYEAQSFLEKGADEVMTEPYNADEALERIGRILERINAKKLN